MTLPVYGLALLVGTVGVILCAIFQQSNRQQALPYNSHRGPVNRQVIEGYDRPRNVTRREPKTCSICMENLSQGLDTTLACFHSFHSKCITQWFKSGSSYCPICRRIPENLQEASLSTSNSPRVPVTQPVPTSRRIPQSTQQPSTSNSQTVPVINQSIYNRSRNIRSRDRNICMDYICTDNLSEGMQTMVCYHSFHRKCIAQWFDLGNKDCPLCRRYTF